ncbi:MAG: hypothetical protein ACKVOR_01310, partial [Flavobacteriales bacterium]
MISNKSIVYIRCYSVVLIVEFDVGVACSIFIAQLFMVGDLASAAAVAISRHRHIHRLLTPLG